MARLVLAALSPDPAGAREPEIFASIQGEGPSAGCPVAFLRLSRCNLACQWCDTAYSWRFVGDNRPHRDGIHFDRRANQLTLDVGQVAERIARLGQNRLVITGGEPLLQQRALAALAEALEGSEIEIETNGTIAPDARLDARVAQYNVSPKLAHSGNPAELALRPEVLAHYAGDARAFFKFVIAEKSDIEQVRRLQEKLSIPSSRIFLMAEGTNSQALRKKQAWLVEPCLAHGWRLSDRLHIHLFGDSRGT